MRVALGALLALACSGQPSADAAVDAPVSVDAPMSDGQCGAETCAVTEYCVVICTCCGVPGGTPSSRYECRPFTRSCDANHMCACPEVAALRRHLRSGGAPGGHPLRVS